jgi:hypothetical protein
MQDFQILGQRVRRAIYDPDRNRVLVIYRSGRGRRFLGITPQRMLSLINALRGRSPSLLWQGWLCLFML